MVLSDVLGLTAAGWGVVMAIAPALQIRTMLRTRSARDVSLGYFSLLIPGFLLWVLYGLARQDWPLVVPNAVATAVAIATITVAARLRYRNASGDARR
ncbi:SemiSWEET family sugar transporter [Microbacterium luticocti]|uniref:SemiSWEET family sugar transporter n=1 Tax=Microbacterium luticocti TaxID=451764 RepID=UPI0003F6CAAF|nr:SemiSWEET family transporter [Microbacterium luticocti]